MPVNTEGPVKVPFQPTFLNMNRIMSLEGSHGHVVAKHYNEIKKAGRETRNESRILYMRNFNNWIKSVVIADAIQRLKRERGNDSGITALDLCSGKGGDLLKWKKGGIKKLICADIAEMSVEQSEQKYNEMKHRERFPERMFSAEFIAADCSKIRLKYLYKNPEAKVDVCSCQFSFHYCFESYSQTEMMLRNAAECLSLGGYFIGTTTNSHELVRRLRDAPGMSFGNEIYRVTFETKDKENFPIFGARYNFELEGVVNCPEFLVYFPVLEKMAEKYGLKLVLKKPFAEYFKSAVENRDHRNLLGRMQALETYPPEYGSRLFGSPDSDYEFVKSYLEKLRTAESYDGNQNGRRPFSVGTLSKAEWEADTLYCVFMFQKVTDPETGEKWVDKSEMVNASRKRSHDPAENLDGYRHSKFHKSSC